MSDGDATGDPPNLLQVKLMKRLLNMGGAALCVTTSILEVISIPGLSALVIAGYSIALCSGIFLSEMTEMAFMKFILSNHGYLYNPFFRFLFYLLIASMQASFNGLLSFIAAGCMVVLAFINAYWLIRYPGLRNHVAGDGDSGGRRRGRRNNNNNNAGDNDI